MARIEDLVDGTRCVCGCRQPINNVKKAIFVSPLGWFLKGCNEFRLAKKAAAEQEAKARADANGPYVSRFQPFETMNLSPHGEKVRISSLRQLRQEEGRFGVTNDLWGR